MSSHTPHYESGSNMATECMRAIERLAEKHLRPNQTGDSDALKRAGFSDRDAVKQAVLAMRVKMAGEGLPT